MSFLIRIFCSLAGYRSASSASKFIEDFRGYHNTGKNGMLFKDMASEKGTKLTINFYGIVYLVALTFLILLFSGCSIEGFKEFLVSDISINDGGVIGTDRKGIRLIFDKEVDADSAYDSIRVEEEGNTQVSIDLDIDGKVIFIVPIEKWKPHKRYWLIIDGDIEDKYGKKLRESFYISFKSTDEVLPVSAMVIDPAIKYDVVDENINCVKIAFTNAVDRASIERAFTISPEIEGNFNWQSNRSFNFEFNENPLKNRLYTISITDSGLDANGYPIKEFTRIFEYCPNTEHPEVDSISLDGNLIFDKNNPDSYAIEDDTCSIDVGNIEKNFTLRLNFTTSIDKESFENGFEIIPSVNWNASWQDENTVNISFNDNLALAENYRMELGTNVKSMDGLVLKNKYLISGIVLGDYSRYLSFYANSFTELSIDAALSNGGTPVPVTNVTSGLDDDGNFINIIYTDPSDPEDLEATILLTMRFLSDKYTPYIKKDSLQDAVNFSFVAGTNPGTSSKTGNINGYEWISGNECILKVGETGKDNIYHLHISGGLSGVLDNHDNYMKDDIDYYFKLKIQ